MPKEDIENKIKKIIRIYLDYIEKIGIDKHVTEEEGYKFDFVDNFQKTLKGDPKFEDMLEALSYKNCNLTASAMYYPAGMLEVFYEENPSATQKLFEALFDENIPIKNRIDAFKNGFERMMEKRNARLKKNDHTYFDSRFISVLLAARYPNKYYMIKPTQYKRCINFVSDEKIRFTGKTIGEKYEIYHQFADQVKKLAALDEDIKIIHNSFLRDLNDESGRSYKNFDDNKYHWTVQDIIFITGDLLSDMQREGDASKTLSDGSPQYWTISPGKGADHWDEFYQNGIIGIGWDGTDDLKQYKDKKEIQRVLKKMFKMDTNASNNAQACLDFSQTMKVGDYLFVKRGVREMIGYGQVISDYIYDESRSEFRHIRKVRWLKKGNWEIKKSEQPALKTLTNITKYTDHVEALLKIIGETSGENSNPSIKNMKNLIIYGPPGTGKTYQVLKMAEELLSKQTKKESREERIEKIVQDLTWREVIGLIFLVRKKEKYKVPEIAEDEIAQAKRRALGRETRVNPTIWASLQSDSDPKSETVNISMRSGLGLFDKDLDSNWYLTKTGQEYFSSYGEMAAALSDVKPETKDWKEYMNFITFHQSYSYEEFVEGIRPTLDSEQVKYNLKDGVFKKMCKAAENDPDNQYLMVIDEINRGNISKIFGELITLIEDDKRIGGENEIRVTLPYSGDSFGVPMNLQIFGTMNTADRSIALLDVALRRRFAFRELMPEYQETGLDNLNVDQLNIGKMLRSINEKIEVMIDRDHQIGHSYFLKIKGSDDKKQALQSVWYDEVIPLVKEYFYNDWGKISHILGKFEKEQGTGFVEMRSETEIRTLFDGENGDDYSDATIGNIHQYSGDELINALSKL